MVLFIIFVSSTMFQTSQVHLQEHSILPAIMVLFLQHRNGWKYRVSARTALKDAPEEGPVRPETL
jgi:hypothetical protein